MKNKEKPKFNTVQNISWMVNIAWKNRRRVLLFCVLTAILEVLLNLTQLYIAPKVLSRVEQKSPMWMLLTTIGVFTVHQGSHASLVADTNGKYYELWNAQVQYYMEQA